MNCKKILIMASMFLSISGISQTVTIRGNVQTNTLGDQSNIEVYVINETYISLLEPVTDYYTVYSDAQGNYSVSFDLYDNTTGYLYDYFPADLTIIFSQDGFEDYIISNFVVQEEESILMDNIILFPAGADVYTPTICMVRVSDSTYVNNVVWERQEGFDIDSYIVYRSSDTAWIPIDTLGFDELSVCEDFEMEEDTSIARQNYQIQAVFTNNTKSGYSEAMKAPQIKVTMVEGFPQIQWMNLRDFTRLDAAKVERIVMFRSLTPDNFEPYDSISTEELNSGQDPLSFFTQLDRSMTEDGIYYYRVGYRLFTHCAPDSIYSAELPLGGVLKAESGPFSLAMSNIAESEYVEADDPVNTQNVSPSSFLVSVLNSSVVIDSKTSAEKYSIYSVNGILVATGEVRGVTSVPLSSGSYLVCVGKNTSKIVIP